jgi:hypothetical protein
MTQNSSTPIHNARCSPEIFGIISNGPRKLRDLNKLNAIGLPGGFTRTKFSLYTSSASEGGNFPEHPFKDFDLVVLRSQNGKTRVFTQINPENPWNAHSSQLALRNHRVDLLLSCAQLQVESLERVYRSTLAPLVGKQTTNERRAARSDRGFLDQLDIGQLSLNSAVKEDENGADAQKHKGF